MNTITECGLVPRVVTDPSEIEQLRWFQTQRYFESGLLTTMPRSLPEDQFLEDSTYFGVFYGDQIQATARIVRSSNSAELLRYHPLFPAAHARMNVDRDCIAEVSRLAVASHTPHYQALSLLSREFLRHGVLHQEGLLLVCSIGRPLVRILNRLLGVPVEIIGPPIDRYGDFVEETLPVLIDTVRCLDRFRMHDGRRWEFFLEGMVIDLTDPIETRTHGYSYLPTAV